MAKNRLSARTNGLLPLSPRGLVTARNRLCARRACSLCSYVLPQRKISTRHARLSTHTVSADLTCRPLARSGTCTGLWTHDPSGHCHVFPRSVFEVGVTCHWAITGQKRLSRRGACARGVSARAHSMAREIFFQNFEKSVKRSLWRRADPWNRIRMAIFH